MSKQTLKDFKMPEFQDRNENYDILKEIEAIQKKRSIYKYDEIQLMHSDFAEQNPELFEKCSRENMTEDEIKHMIFLLDIRQQVKEGKLTYEKASNIVSIHMANKYQPELLQKNGFSKKNRS